MQKLRGALVTVVVLLCANWSAGSAQTGLLVVAHGANPTWNAAVHATVAQVTWPAGPVATAFLMGGEAESAGWDQGIDALVRQGARSIVVVPLMVSSAGAHHRQIQFYAGALAELPPELAGHAHGGHARPPVPTRVTPALDGAPELAARIGELWTGLAPDDRRGSLMFVAHGPSSDADAAMWIDDLRRAIAPVAAAAGVPFDIGLLRDDAGSEVRAAAVEDSRARIRELARATGDSVTVLPVLVSTGRIATTTIPRDLIGLPIRYVPAPLAPSAHLARWIERVALARVAASH